MVRSNSHSSSSPQYYVPRPKGPRPALIAGATRHNVFYFEDGSLSVFQVEDRLYRVHRYFLQKSSPMFRAMFAYQPGTVRGVAEGAEDSKPIFLDGTSCIEFESLLSFFYDDNMHHDFAMTPEQWLALLSIAERFGFENAKKRAIAELFSLRPRLEPAERIAIAERLELPRERYLLPAVRELVMRSRPMQAREVSKMSAETVAGISYAREEFLLAAVRATTPGSPTPDSSHPRRALPTQVLKKIATGTVCSIFADPGPKFSFPILRDPIPSANVDH
ncbi:hypothetical protein EVG20_g5063 [Dentipellis fragilis]|uniref:BTB domain-containing protein n=1 Tax=Dentipellis fragilis TaxID=205917 RepID=A0A4Y9YTY1_9AGAM|nr:hypothetical protein EVG20_g5063 [Dentipellis fragilis]